MALSIWFPEVFGNQQVFFRSEYDWGIWGLFPGIDISNSVNIDESSRYHQFIKIIWNLTVWSWFVRDEGSNLWSDSSEAYILREIFTVDMKHYFDYFIEYCYSKKWSSYHEDTDFFLWAWEWHPTADIVEPHFSLMKLDSILDLTILNFFIRIFKAVHQRFPNEYKVWRILESLEKQKSSAEFIVKITSRISRQALDIIWEHFDVITCQKQLF
jgi:hypothetical protein